MRKKNKSSIIILIVMVAILGLFFLQKYIFSEIKTYKSYDDFTRASDIMLLSFNKNFELQYPVIRYIQSSNFNEKETEGSLIHDFAKHDMIPILNYLNSNNDNKELVQAFNVFTGFLANYNAATYNRREDMLVRLNGKDYFKLKDNIYTYKVEKKVIKKDFFHKIYGDYLKTINEKNVQNNFINKLYSNSEIKENYSYDKLMDDIRNNYEKFYNRNENIIIEVIANDLKGFSDYINEKIINVPEDGMPSLKIKEEDVETEKIQLYYNFKELDRIYNPASKYYTHSYQLDIENVWKQLTDLGYPKLYH